MLCIHSLAELSYSLKVSIAAAGEDKVMDAPRVIDIEIDCS